MLVHSQLIRCSVPGILFCRARCCRRGGVVRSYVWTKRAKGVCFVRKPIVASSYSLFNSPLVDSVSRAAWAAEADVKANCMQLFDSMLLGLMLPARLRSGRARWKPTRTTKHGAAARAEDCKANRGRRLWLSKTMEGTLTFDDETATRLQR